MPLRRRARQLGPHASSKEVTARLAPVAEDIEEHEDEEEEDFTHVRTSRASHPKIA